MPTWPSITAAPLPHLWPRRRIAPCSSLGTPAPSPERISRIDRRNRPRIKPPDKHPYPPRSTQAAPSRKSTRQRTTDEFQSSHRSTQHTQGGNMSATSGILNPVTAPQANPLMSAQAMDTSTSSSSSSDTTISANDFLTLLVTEMQNQDPTSDTDPNEYIDQLVNVNSLEQLININQTLPTAFPSASADASASLASGSSTASAQTSTESTKAASAHANSTSH